jgi:hypothetical protein
MIEMEDEKKIIDEALETCAELRKALEEVEKARKAIRLPLDMAGGALDIDALRGELDAIALALKNARYAEAALRDFFDDLVGLFKRLQHAYRTVYRVWQSAQQDSQLRERTAEIRIIRRVIADMDEHSAALTNKFTALLVKRQGLERYALQQDLNALITKYQD